MQKIQPVIVVGTNSDSALTSDTQPMSQSDSLPRVGEMPSVAGVSTESQMMDSMEVDCNATEHQMPYEQTSIQEVRAQIDRQFCDDYCG